MKQRVGSCPQGLPACLWSPWSQSHPNSARPQPHTCWAGCPAGAPGAPAPSPPGALAPLGQARQGGSGPRRVSGSPLGSQAGTPEGPAFVHPPLQSCFAVVLGGPQETGRLLEHKFDYIFFTGEGQLPGAGRGSAQDGRGERPEASPTLRPCPQLLERGSEDRGRQLARKDTGVSAEGVPSAPGQAAWREGVAWTPWGPLGSWTPSQEQASPPITVSRHSICLRPPLSELRLCQALPHHPTALLGRLDRRGLETWVTKRCSAHLTSQGWGRLDFAPEVTHCHHPGMCPWGPDTT